MAREPAKQGRNTGKSKSEEDAKGAADKGANEAKDNQGASSVGPIEFLAQQHQRLQAMLAKRSESEAEPNAIMREFVELWLPHQAVEAEFLVPALRDSGFDEAKIAASEIRKDIINILLADLLQGMDDGFAGAKLDALASELDTLVQAASQNSENVQAAIASATDKGPSSELAERYERLKRQFADMDSIGEALVMLAPRRLSVSFNSQRSRREYPMSSRYSNMRERDEQGRFTSDDERGYRGSRGRGGPERDEQGRFMSEGGGSRSRGRYDDEDERYGHGSTGRERDEEGRFMSEGGGRSRGRYEDEDDRYGRRSMSRERDDEGRSGRRGGGSEGRGHGGWFGDSEGHSEASRRGWESGSHGESGWYGDPEGHSEASRRGWENPRHGESGWYGDPEGHSEASRRGWEHGHEGNYRGRSSRDDEMRSRSRSRYDDERGNGGRGHGGWSGDPEGHSEASRRGWQNRR
jgi:hypothetical protein